MSLSANPTADNAHGRGDSSQSTVSVGSGSRFSQASSGSDLPLSVGDHRPSAGQLSRLIDAVEAQIRRGNPVEFGALAAVWDAVKNQHGIGLDDRKMLLEHILVFISRLPPDLPLNTRTERFLIDLLYKDLPHPPTTFLAPLVLSPPFDQVAPTLKGFAYHSTNGSYNNPLIPHLGAAHTPYARSVTASHVTPAATLPDPAVIFDALLRRDKEVEHPTGLSSMFFAFANFIIHSLFWTDPKDWRFNNTSSYLDLSPLYGVDAESQKNVRNVEGKGQLKVDTFADYRLLAMPASICALLVVFNRNHNFIATRILEINEGGTYRQDVENLKPEERQNQDDEIFNRARLVNCATFMQVILRDYVGAILRMIPELTPWHLSPLEEFRGSGHELTPRGEGNACSVEFNLLYRWHAATSRADTKWLEEFWKNEPGLGNKSYDDVTPEEFVKAAANAIRSRIHGGDVTHWEFGGIKRSNGKFDDGDLANILQSATAEAANAFRARGIPAVFKVIEILGIQQSRKWGSCSLNEFRTFLGLKPYSSFKEWNPDSQIYEAAERLYHHIDNLELYVGMQAEETRPSVPGSGLCSGYTMSRAILADAVSLIRGDRFLTVECTPHNLTSWGFRDAQSDDDNGSFGGMLTKLLLRTLPRHYHAGSAFAHFPFFVPERMREFMVAKNPAMVDLYNWKREKPLLPALTVNSYNTVREVVTDRAKFGTPYETAIARLTNGHGFYLVSNNAHDRAMIERTVFNATANAEHAQFYYDVTRELIADKSFPVIGTTSRTVDIVAHVINFIPVHWVANRVAGLSLSTKENPNGKYSEQELYGYLSVLFTYIFLNPDSTNTWFLERNALRAANVLLSDIKKNLQDNTSFFSGIKGAIANVVGVSSPGDNILRRLCETNGDRDIDVLLYNVFGVIVNSAANWAHAMSHVINFYLDDSRRVQKADIVALSNGPYTPDKEKRLSGYAREAMRIDPPVAGVFRYACSDCQVSGTQLLTGQPVVADLDSAYLDKEHYGPDPSAINPSRPRGASPLEFVIGAHTSLNADFSDKTMAQVLRAIYSKKNIRRAAGESGKLTRFTANVYGTSQTLYIDSMGHATRWPQSLLLQFDI